MLYLQTMLTLNIFFQGVPMFIRKVPPFLPCRHQIRSPVYPYLCFTVLQLSELIEGQLGCKLRSFRLLTPGSLDKAANVCRSLCVSTDSGCDGQRSNKSSNTVKMSKHLRGLRAGRAVKLVSLQLLESLQTGIFVFDAKLSDTNGQPILVRIMKDKK